MAELMYLRQTRALGNYDDSFDEMMCKLDLPEDYLVQTYLEGLQERFSGPVRLLKPMTLQDAQLLLQEIHLTKASDENKVSIKASDEVREMNHLGLVFEVLLHTRCR